MKRDVWLVLILGCILILVLEAPAALSSVTAAETVDPWEAPPEASMEASLEAPGASIPEAPAPERRPSAESRPE